MIAASARTSGTTLPASSSLNRGSIASRSAAAWTAALPRMTRVRVGDGTGATAFATGALAAAGLVAVALAAVDVVFFLTTRCLVVTGGLDAVVFLTVDVEVPTLA